MDPLLMGGLLLSGWTAFGAQAALVARSVVTGTWLPLRTHDREMALLRESRDEWKAAARESQSNVAMLLKGGRIAEDFFQKVPVTTLSPGHSPVEAA